MRLTLHDPADMKRRLRDRLDGREHWVLIIPSTPIHAALVVPVLGAHLGEDEEMTVLTDVPCPGLALVVAMLPKANYTPRALAEQFFPKSADRNEELLVTQDVLC